MQSHFCLSQLGSATPASWVGASYSAEGSPATRNYPNIQWREVGTPRIRAPAQVVDLAVFQDLQGVHAGSFAWAWLALVPQQISRELFGQEVPFVPRPGAFLPRGYTTR